MENLNIVIFIKEIKSILIKDLPIKCQAQRLQWQILQTVKELKMPIKLSIF